MEEIEQVRAVHPAARAPRRARPARAQRPRARRAAPRARTSAACRCGGASRTSSGGSDCAAGAPVALPVAVASLLAALAARARRRRRSDRHLARARPLPGHGGARTRTRSAGRTASGSSSARASGSRWIDYPIVVLRRRHRPLRGGATRSRVLAYWEPNAGSRQQTRRPASRSTRAARRRRRCAAPTPAGWKSREQRSSTVRGASSPTRRPGPSRACPTSPVFERADSIGRRRDEPRAARSTRRRAGRGRRQGAARQLRSRRHAQGHLPPARAPAQVHSVAEGGGKTAGEMRGSAAKRWANS